jgi:hypothetical protein
MEHSVGCTHCSYGRGAGQTGWTASQDSAANARQPVSSDSVAINVLSLDADRHTFVVQDAG